MGDWDAVIDVSNVCWSPELPPVGRRWPAWDRLALVQDAWRREHGDDVSFTLVADESLFKALGDSEELRRMTSAGQVRTAREADPLLLTLARDNDLHVITRDHYVDHRDAHPWIEESPKRFHAWETVGGQVRIIPLGVTTRSEQDISMARELKDLKRYHLDPKKPAHRRILHTRWKCANAACAQAATWQGQLLVWPLVTSGDRAMCPTCDAPLEDLGRRPHLFEIVVAVRGAKPQEFMRFPLESGVPVLVGRGTIKGIDLSMSALVAETGLMHDLPPSVRDAVARVSRLHLYLRIEQVSEVNWRLAVLDLESTNGTDVERWAKGGFLPSRKVPTDKEMYLSAKDRLVLGGAIQLRLSGKRYAMHPAGPVHVLSADGADGAGDGHGNGTADGHERAIPSDATIIHASTIDYDPPALPRGGVPGCQRDPAMAARNGPAGYPHCPGW